MKETFEQFVDRVSPLMRKRYEISLLSKEELIGRKVRAIRAGFSCGSEGRDMVVVPLEEGVSYGNPNYIRLADPTGRERGWLCDYNEVPNSMVLLD